MSNTLVAFILLIVACIVAMAGEDNGEDNSGPPTDGTKGPV